MTDPLNLAPLTADALIADPRLTAVLADAEQPLALLPVRLETRYAEGELLVRIYPDQLHVDAHNRCCRAVFVPVRHWPRQNSWPAAWSASDSRGAWASTWS